MPDHFGTLWIKGLKIIFELLNFIILSGKTGIVFLEDLTPGVMLECILGVFFRDNDKPCRFPLSVTNNFSDAICKSTKGSKYFEDFSNTHL